MRPQTADRVTRPKPTEHGALARLVDGARMDQKTFHALYLKTPETFKAELIGGVVHVASPVRSWHGGPHITAAAWVHYYSAKTTGTDRFSDTTSILGNENEPQPDVALVIRPDYGGTTRIDRDGYLHGAPELVVEVAVSSTAIDLHQKRGEYERAGVREYVVLLPEDESVRWFVRRRGRFVELDAGDDGIFRSEMFPGLWALPAAFYATDQSQLYSILDQGLAAPEHAAFVAKLAARKTAKRKKK